LVIEKFSDIVSLDNLILKIGKFIILLVRHKKVDISVLK